MSRLCSIHHDISVTKHTPGAYIWSMVSVWPQWWQPVGGPRDKIWDLVARARDEPAATPLAPARDLVALVWPIRSRVIIILKCLKMWCGWFNFETTWCSTLNLHIIWLNKTDWTRLSISRLCWQRIFINIKALWACFPNPIPSTGSIYSITSWSNLNILKTS